MAADHPPQIHRAPLLILTLLLALSLVLVPSASAIDTMKNQDSSGNGFHLTEEPGLENSVSPLDKYGEGYGFPSANQSTLFSTATELVRSGDLSITIALNSLPDDTNCIASGGNGQDSFPDGLEWCLGSSGSDIEFGWTGPLGGYLHVDCDTGLSDIGSEPLSIWAKRDVGAVSTDVEIKVFNATGAVLCNQVQSPGDTPPDTPNDTFRLGGQPDGQFVCACEIHEFRIWSSVISDATLDSVADPTDGSTELTVLGSELAVYFLEPFVESGTLTNANQLVIQAPTNITAQEAFTIYVHAHNATGRPLTPNAAGYVQITKTRTIGTPNIIYLNETGATTTLPTHLNLSFVSNGCCEVLQERFIDTGLPEPGAWTITAWVPYGQGTDHTNLSTTSPVEVDRAIAEVELQSTEFQDFTHLTGLEFIFLFGLAITGVIIWSRALDTAVRAFASMLPLVSAILLLAFGAEVGLGDTWPGQVPVAGVFAIVGTYMFVRLVLDHLGGQPTD